MIVYKHKRTQKFNTMYLWVLVWTGLLILTLVVSALSQTKNASSELVHHATGNSIDNLSVVSSIDKPVSDLIYPIETCFHAPCPISDKMIDELAAKYSDNFGFIFVPGQGATINGHETLAQFDDTHLLPFVKCLPEMSSVRALGKVTDCLVDADYNMIVVLDMSKGS